MSEMERGLGRVHTGDAVNNQYAHLLFHTCNVIVKLLLQLLPQARPIDVVNYYAEEVVTSSSPHDIEKD